MASSAHERRRNGGGGAEPSAKLALIVTGCNAMFLTCTCICDRRHAKACEDFGGRMQPSRDAIPEPGADPTNLERCPDVQGCAPPLLLSKAEYAIEL